jgi:hypothetical protein
MRRTRPSTTHTEHWSLASCDAPPVCAMTSATVNSSSSPSREHRRGAGPVGGRCERVRRAAQRDHLRLERALDPDGGVAATQARADLLVVAERVLAEDRLGCAESRRQEPVGEEGQAGRSAGDAAVGRIERLVPHELQVEGAGTHRRREPCRCAARAEPRDMAEQGVPCVREEVRVGREEQHAPDARVVDDPGATAQHPGPLRCDQTVRDPAVQHGECRAEPPRITARTTERLGEVDRSQPRLHAGPFERSEVRERALVARVIAPAERIEPRARAFGPLVGRAQAPVQSQRCLERERVLRLALGRDDRRTGCGRRAGHHRDEAVDLRDEQREVRGTCAGQRRCGSAHATGRRRVARRRSAPRPPASARPRCRP